MRKGRDDATEARGADDARLADGAGRTVVGARYIAPLQRQAALRPIAPIGGLRVAVIPVAMIAVAFAAFATAPSNQGGPGSASYPDRPAAAHTGGFGEPTCHACHFDGDLNAPGGRLAVVGLPPRPVAGRAYTVTVELRAPVMERAGFQLAIRTQAGRQAGRLVPIDARATVTDTAGVRYAHHTEGGSTPTRPGVAEWRLRWTAPREAGRLLVHVAANAGNGDDSPLGDAVYAGEMEVGVR